MRGTEKKSYSVRYGLHLGIKKILRIRHKIDMCEMR